MDLSEPARHWAQAALNPLTEVLRDLRRVGEPVLDLITAPAHECGLAFPHGTLVEIATQALREIESVRRYEPDARGQRPAREAIAAFYGRRAVKTDADRIVLAPGTSTAYLWAIRLLADPGDEILVPSPGYPLFEDICRVIGVRQRPYHLSDRSGRWRPDVEDIAFQSTPVTRAVMVISPHNPTGCLFGEEELGALGAVCRERSMAVVFDEVFSEFLAPGLDALPRPRGDEFPLVVTLNGLSKMFSLPGCKIAWIKVDGEPRGCAAFLRALEHMSDTFLPTSELAQAMIPGLMEVGDPEVSTGLSRAYAARRNLAVQLIGPSVHPPEGGVHLCCRLPEGVDDEEFTMRALREQRISVHPGHFYDLPGHFVTSCAPRPGRLREGIGRLRAVEGFPRARG